MRIAFLHQPNDPYTQVRIKYFVSKGYEVYSIVFNSGITQKQKSGVKIFLLPNKLLVKIPFFKRFVYYKNIQEITFTHHIDIFYVVSALNSLYLKASSAKSNILEIQGSDIIKDPINYPFLKPFYKVFWKYADRIIADSQLALNKAQPYMTDNINEIIEIGIDLSIFNPSVKKGLVRKKYHLNNRPIVFHSRSIKKLYNLGTIIKSILIVRERIPDVCFLFTGDMDDLNKESKKFIESQDLHHNIIFCGRLIHETEIKYFYADANLVVSVPSSDSSPFSVYEAMATKTPVIVSELPWYKNKFIPGKHLITVPVKDEIFLAKAIIEILNNEVVLD